MKEFLSRLYCGQIHPNEGAGRYYDEILPLERLSNRILEELNGEISEKAKEDLKKYINCQQELSFFAEQDAFARGVGFAAKFFVAAID